MSTVHLTTNKFRALFIVFLCPFFCLYAQEDTVKDEVEKETAIESKEAKTDEVKDATVQSEVVKISTKDEEVVKGTNVKKGEVRQVTVDSIIPPPPPWQLKNRLGVDLSEVTFVNWNAGGVNSIAALAHLRTELIHTTEKMNWSSFLSVRYGINKQESIGVQKTDDIFEIGSKLGYNTSLNSNWYYSGYFNLKTQMTDGFSSPEKVKPISRLFAPGYVLLGVGVEYGKTIEKFSLYMSPLTMKSTFVLDSDLANSGAFGVRAAVKDADGNILKEGQKVRAELGILINKVYNTSLFQNIDLISRMQLYTDYLDSFGNIDVNWELLLNMKVNDFVKANLGSHIIYDDDVRSVKKVGDEKVEDGPKLQWKQILGIGVIVDF